MRQLRQAARLCACAEQTQAAAAFSGRHSDSTADCHSGRRVADNCQQQECGSPEPNRARGGATGCWLERRT